MNARKLITALVLTFAFGAAAQAQQPEQTANTRLVIERVDGRVDGRARRPGDGPTIQEGVSAQESVNVCPSFCLSVEPNTPALDKYVEFTISIYDLRTLEVVPNATFNFTWEPVANSGGHDHHDASRPKGEFSPASGSTGPSGVITIRYTPPEVAGIVGGNVTCAVPTGGVCVGGLVYVFTLHPGLEELGPGTNYDLVGETTTHTKNHFGTPTFNGKLVKIANAYAAKYKGAKLAYNDMSLEFGGLFDYHPDFRWQPPHEEHRWGKTVDMYIDNVPVERRNSLDQILRSHKIDPLDESANHHWHLRF